MTIGMLHSYIQSGANMNEFYSNGYTPLMVATCLGNERVVSELLSLTETPVHLDNVTVALESAAHLAVRFQQWSVLKLLVEAGADIDNPSAFGVVVRDCLPMAVQAGIEIPALPRLDMTERTEPRQLPAQREFVKKLHAPALITDVLTADGAARVNVDEDGWPFVSRVILARAANVQNGGDFKTETRLQKMFRDCVDFHDVNAVNRFGYTPLMIATLCGNTATVESLLVKGAHLNAVNVYGENAGHLAYQLGVVTGDFNLLKLLIERGVDMKRRAFTGLALNDKINVLETLGWRMTWLRRKNDLLIQKRAAESLTVPVDLPLIGRLVLNACQPQKQSPKEMELIRQYWHVQHER